MAPGSKHDKFRLRVDGKYLAHTVVSRGHNDISEVISSLIARQLGVSKRDLHQMIDCTLDRDGYISSLEG